jgi:geranylgeranyl diphosphate synthase, type II
LPLMDNDDERRGRPTNHKVYGEAMALLAGDALLTEAFTVLSHGHANDPRVALELVNLLSRSAGVRGMVAGQALDILPMSEKLSEREIQHIHDLKTGALIHAAVDGAACLAGVDPARRQHLSVFGKCLGLAFQIADDLEDYDAERSEPTSFTSALGVAGTRELLYKVNSQAEHALRAAGLEDSKLSKICQFNLERANGKSNSH